MGQRDSEIMTLSRHTRAVPWVDYQERARHC